MALDTERSRVAHLLRRAGFGFTESELDEFTALGFAGALERLLNFEQVDDSALEQYLASLQLDLNNYENARFWWLVRMLYTRRPLQEKMALFWHNHFATASSKVRQPPLMLQQIALFREYALGNFEVLLQKVTRDPAMLYWLDNRDNRKGAPNENYAREVMELFTVGIGNYTEEDIKEAARAFTGYTSNRESVYVFNPDDHDNDLKTFMGETRNWDADDILATLVRHPATARYVPGKLFRFFVNDQPSAATSDRLAATFVSSNFDIRAVVRDILSGPEFLATDAYHAQVKQPIELVIGTLKALEVKNVAPDLPQVIRKMGQDLLNPPDVSGWKGGAAWLNSSTLLERFNFADRLTSRPPDQPYFTDVAGPIVNHDLRTAADIVNFYTRLLVDGDVTREARGMLIDYLAESSFEDGRLPEERVRSTVHLVMSLPTYQLA